MPAPRKITASSQAASSRRCSPRANNNRPMPIRLLTKWDASSTDSGIKSSNHSSRASTAGVTAENSNTAPPISASSANTCGSNIGAHGPTMRGNHRIRSF